MKVFTLAASLAALCGSVVPAQDLDRSAPPEIDKALREQVEGFYEAFKLGRFRAAEEYVDDESKEIFYQAKKNRIVDFNIQSVKYAEDFRGAQVLVGAKMLMQGQGAALLSMPLTSEWRFLDGAWKMHVPPPKTVAGGGVDSPAGAMRFGSSGKPGGSMAPVTLESLAGMYEVSAERLAFPAEADAPVVREFRVKNRAKGSLTLELESEEIPGLEVRLPEAALGPDEEGVVSVVYDPSRGALKGRRELKFTVMPIVQRFTIVAQFE